MKYSITKWIFKGIVGIIKLFGKSTAQGKTLQKEAQVYNKIGTVKCAVCSSESDNIKKYGFYVGKRTYDSGGAGTVRNITYQINTEPITDYVCNNCISDSISINRKKALGWIIFFGISSVIFLLLVFLFNYLEFEGLKDFLIVLAVITGLVLLIFLVIYFMENKEDTGDLILVHLYLYDLRHKGYDTYSTRNGYKNKRYYPLAFSKM